MKNEQEKMILGKMESDDNEWGYGFMDIFTPLIKVKYVEVDVVGAGFFFEVVSLA